MTFSALVGQAVSGTSNLSPESSPHLEIPKQTPPISHAVWCVVLLACSAAFVWVAAFSLVGAAVRAGSLAYTRLGLAVDMGKKRARAKAQGRQVARSCSAACGTDWRSIRRMRDLGQLVRLLDEGGARCGHVVCKSCAYNMSDWATRHSVGYIYCPLCRSAIYSLEFDGGGSSRAVRTVREVAAERAEEKRGRQTAALRAKHAAKEDAMASQWDRRIERVATLLLQELPSEVERKELCKQLWLLALGGRLPARLPPFSRNEKRMADRFSYMVSGSFPLVAELCAENSAVYL